MLANLDLLEAHGDSENYHIQVLGLFCNMPHIFTYQHSGSTTCTMFLWFLTLHLQATSIAVVVEVIYPRSFEKKG